MNATMEDLKAISASFETSSPEAVLEWGIREFGSGMALVTGFGVEGCVLMDMVARLSSTTRILYLDTGLLFPETYSLRERLQERYGVTIERHATQLSLEEQAKTYGEKLWETNPDECCRLRKVEPLRTALAGLDAWVTGIRREQSGSRANADLVEWDAKFGLVKINPLVFWSTDEVWNYARQNNVPYNPLYERDYTSV
ncbi:MAG TPA: phosphoadenylyl-sulfate reductase, partial [Pyrinomonadaceae bacterium]